MTTAAVALILSATATASVITPVALIPWLTKRGSYDFPVERSSHLMPVPRGGGIAVIVGYIVGTVAFLALEHPAPVIWPLVAAPVLLGLLGLGEDLRSLSIRARLTGQLTIALASSVWLTEMTHVELYWAACAAFVVVAYVNMTNFMDGIDGISGLHGTIAGITYLVIGIHETRIGLEAAGGLLAAAYVGFLPWNVPRARLFLGDCGSYFLGGAVAMLGVTALFEGATFELAAAPMAAYATDTAWTLFRRYRRNERLHESHRSHVYQRLTDERLTHLNAALTVSSVTVILVALAAIGSASSVTTRIATDCLAVALLACYLASPSALALMRTRTQGRGGEAS